MESRRNLFPFKCYFHFRFPLPVSRPIFEFPMSADVGQCRHCHIRVGHTRKYGGSRWNRFEICFRSKVISTSGLHFRFRGRHLSFRCRAMSAASYSGRAWSKMWGSRWNRVEICFRSKVISTSGLHFRFRGRHLSFRCRPMSNNVGSVIFRSGMAEILG